MHFCINRVLKGTGDWYGAVQLCIISSKIIIKRTFYEMLYLFSGINMLWTKLACDVSYNVQVSEHYHVHSVFVFNSYLFGLWSVQGCQLYGSLCITYLVVTIRALHAILYPYKIHVASCNIAACYTSHPVSYHTGLV